MKFGAFVLLALALRPQQQLAPTHSRLVFETFPSSALAGNLLRDPSERNVVVYLPPSYDSVASRRYPVVYLLHGNGGNSTTWTNGRYQGLNIKEAMDSLIGSGTLREMIIV